MGRAHAGPWKQGDESFQKDATHTPKQKETHADPLDTHHPIHVQKAAAADTLASHPIQDTYEAHAHIHRRKAYHSSTRRRQTPDAGAPRHHHMTGSTNDAIRRHELEAESERLTGDCTDGILDGSLCDKPPLRVALLRSERVLLFNASNRCCCCCYSNSCFRDADRRHCDTSGAWSSCAVCLLCLAALDWTWLC